MRIIRLTAENVKRLKAVDITPDGDVVVIAGKNAQGKTAVLDAIWMALAGGNATKGSPKAIREGQKKATVRLDLGDLVVTRKWTEAGGTTLEVVSGEKIETPLGSAPKLKYSSPQAVLDGLIGYLTFDPFRFSEAGPKEQLGFLLATVKLPFDPAVLAAERAELFAQRTDINRDAKGLLVQFEALPVAPVGTPAEEVSAADAAQALGDARSRNGAIPMAARSLAIAKDSTEAAREALAAAEAHEKVMADRLAELGDPVDTEPLEAALLEVDQVNAAVRAEQQRLQVGALLELAQKQSHELTGKLDAIDQRKADAVAAAKMPLEGLSFDEEGVLFNGLPFSQASASERLRVGTAIAMELNPQIRVIRIEDGSLLDSESMAVLEEMAGEHDFQIWVERVDESGKVGITIEDGMVAE